jgi:N-acetylmuramic acid 6-phosphate etherase
MSGGQHSSDARASGASPLGQLATEAINATTYQIDSMSPLEIVGLMNVEDASVAGSVRQELPAISSAIEAISERLRSGGRLIYIGAGTSGRLGALDAYECPPTFNVPKELVVSCVAGTSPGVNGIEGEPALDTAADYEDNAEAGAADISQLDIGKLDALVGITASGRTPYVLGAIGYAKQQGAFTIGLACNRDTPLAQLADIVIAPVVGPEVIAGSTRLKAGTAQKMVLNMLSTGSMILLGNTYGNMMVDLQVTNEKLRERAIRIVEEVTRLDRESAERALEACNQEIKTTILAEQAHLTPELARARLAAHGDRLRSALEATG